MIAHRQIFAALVGLGCLTGSGTSAGTAACSVSGGDIDFGDAGDGSVMSNAASDIAVTCVGGPPSGTLTYTLRINSPLSGPSGQRSMRNAATGGTIRYELYSDAAYSIILNEVTPMYGTVRFNGAGFSTSITGATKIRARISTLDLPNATTGIYADTLVTTIEF